MALIDIFDTAVFCVLTMKLLNVTQLHKSFFKDLNKCPKMLRNKTGGAENGNEVQQHADSEFQHAASIKGH